MNIYTLLSLHPGKYFMARDLALSDCNWNPCQNRPDKFVCLASQLRSLDVAAAAVTAEHDDLSTTLWFDRFEWVVFDRC